jgi:hypothetical protein
MRTGSHITGLYPASEWPRLAGFSCMLLQPFRGNTVQYPLGQRAGEQ